MEKATKIISKIVAIAMIVIAALGVVSAVLSLIGLGNMGANGGQLLGAIIFPIILTVAELVIGILLLGAVKDLASTKYFVMIIVATVLLLLDVVAKGAATMAGALFFALFNSTGIASLFTVIAIALLLASIAALVLKIVMVCKK